MPTYPLSGQSQNHNDFVHPYKGAGTYSNWAVFSTNQLLSAMPLNDHEPGDGRHPHGIQMSRWFRGLETVFPMDDPGLGTRLDSNYFRWHPFEYKGLDGAEIFGGDWGHEPQRSLYYSFYSNLIFDGLEISEVLKSSRVGHETRWFTAAAGQSGRTDPYDYGSHSISGTPIEDPGKTIPEEYDNPYGFNKVQEWQGVPSARAL